MPIPADGPVAGARAGGWIPAHGAVTRAADSKAWWAKRRLVLNAALVAAGMASLTVDAALLELSRCTIPKSDLTPMTLVYQALEYLGAMAVANAAWFAAGQLERRLDAPRVPAYRRWTFGLALASSALLPFLSPLLLLARCR